MQIVFFETEGWESELLTSLDSEHELVFTAEALNPDNVQQYKDAAIISPFVHSTLDRSVLQYLPNLKYIATRSTGFDHIELGYCQENSIAVSNVPVYGTNTVAEHTFALLLALSHHIPEAVNCTRRGDFSGTGLRGFDLHGKTLGVIGTGNIGKRVVEIARAFGMRVLAHDIAPDEEFARQQSADYVAMDALLQQSDCISLHVPGGESTRELLSDAQFAQMKKGVVLINTARGSVINIKALLTALADGTVAATGIDVLPAEAAMKSHPDWIETADANSSDHDTLFANKTLLEQDNVIITPHSAFNTREAIVRILQTTAENIENFIADNPRNLVNDQ